MEPTTEIISDKVFGRSCNMAGSGPKQENQDSFVVKTYTHLNIDHVITVMCDGHGIFGKTFADKVAAGLVDDIIDSFQLILSFPKLHLTRILGNFNDSLENANLHDGGTTVTILIQTAGHVICANLGDCDAHIKLHPTDALNTETDITFCHEMGGEPSLVPKNHVLQLTEDHSGESDAEVHRVMGHANCTLIYGQSENNQTAIEACELNLMHPIVDDVIHKIKRVPYQTVPGVYASDVNMTIASYFYHRTSRLRLNIGRALGDYEYPFVTDAPSVCELRYPQHMVATTIIGTDGYFNCLTTAELESQLNLTPQEICDNSVKFVEGSFGCNHADNMTVVAISM